MCKIQRVQEHSVKSSPLPVTHFLPWRQPAWNVWCILPKIFFAHIRTVVGSLWNSPQGVHLWYSCPYVLSSPSVWAGLTDLLLWTEHCRSSGVLLLKLTDKKTLQLPTWVHRSLSGLSPSERSAGASRQPHGVLMWKTEASRQPRDWAWKKIPNGPPPAQLSLQLRPQPQLTAQLQLHVDLRQRQPAKLCADSWPMETLILVLNH